MCWKQEWAQAIENLNSAITHVERAQLKLHKRLQRNEKNLQRLSQDKNHNYPSELAPVQALIKKNRDAEQNCKEAIVGFRKTQGLLYCMIHTVGIWRKTKEGKQQTSRRTYTLMGNYIGKINCNTTDCEDCPLPIIPEEVEVGK